MLHIYNDKNLINNTHKILNRRAADIEHGMKTLRHYLSFNTESLLGHDTREALHYFYENTSLILENLNNYKLLNDLILHCAYVGTLRTMNRLVHHKDVHKIKTFISATFYNEDLNSPYFKFQHEQFELIDLTTNNRLQKINKWLKEIIKQKKQIKSISLQLNLF